MQILRRNAYLGLQRLIGSNVGTRYAEFLHLEKAGLQSLQSLHERRLQKTLQHAAREVPFYRERVSANGDLDLSDFPILTKDDVRSQFIRLMPEAVRVRHQTGGPRNRYSWIEVKTGGSTGVPTTVIHGPAYRDMGRAARMYSQALCGFPFGVPYLRLWGSMRDVNQMKDNWRQRLTRHLAGESVLNAFRMDPARMESYLTAIAESKVNHLMAYVDCAVQLARFAQSRARSVRPVHSIMACAGTVTRDARDTLRRVFGARVHNKYGSRDCAEMACECSYGGLHIYSNAVAVEVVDDNGKPLPPRSTGRLLITLLDNPEFPLIRYEIGDVGSLDSTLCRCGRPFPLLHAVEGRIDEHFITAGGSYLSPVSVRHLIGVVHNPGLIRRYQLVQETPYDYQLLLEPEADSSPGRLSEVSILLRRDLLALLGRESRLGIQLVESIPESPSGKFRYLLSKVPRTHLNCAVTQ